MEEIIEKYWVYGDGMKKRWANAKQLQHLGLFGEVLVHWET